MLRGFKLEIKLFVIVAFIAVVISLGAILFLKTIQPSPDVPYPSISDSSRSIKIELTDDLMGKVKDKILQSDYAKLATKHWVWRGDINKDGIAELVIIQIPSIDILPQLEVFNVLDAAGSYRRVASFDFEEIKRRDEYAFSPNQDVPVLNMVADINNDGLVEMHLTWSVGSVRPSSTEAFLVVDWEKKEISFMEPLLDAGRGMNSGGFWSYTVEIGNIDKDPSLEIVKLSEWSETNPYTSEDLAIEKWKAEVYDWNGSNYIYSKELSASGEREAPEFWRKLQAIDLFSSGTKQIDPPDAFQLED